MPTDGSLLILCLILKSTQGKGKQSVFFLLFKFDHTAWEQQMSAPGLKC